MKTAKDYLVYSCPDCGKRIFTERRFTGRTGTCPLCQSKHPVGGLRVAEEAKDRRGARRVQPNYRTGVEVQGGPLEREALAPVVDLSATGVGFAVQGEPDPRLLSGFRPPRLKLGDMIEVSLHSTKIGVRPRAYRVEVKRIVPGQPRGTYLVGAQFVGMTPDLEDHLADLLAGGA